jgi:predicted O-methyltransferase YrrM
MNFSLAFKYLNYILFSRHGRGHGIHSPFVFNLVSVVFRNNAGPGISIKVEQIRKRLIYDPGRILVNDLGSRSGSVKTDVRKVSDIARKSSVPRKYGKLLANMAAEFGTPSIIELGTSFGISTMYMAASCPEAKVLTIEGCKSIADIARQNFAEAALNNINLFEGTFEDILPLLLASYVSPGLVFIDGNHRKEPVLNYFRLIADFSGRNTVVIIDDINYSTEMSQAWNEIKLHEKVSVSIDLFRMGILFFREGINHNHYIIRY